MATKSTAKKPNQQTSQPFNKVNNLLDRLSLYKNIHKSKKFYIILAIAALLLLAVYKKEWFIAATVNGSPISNLDLQMRLNKSFRSQTLNQLINEKIILNEAQKNNIVVSAEDVDKKIVEIEKSIGGAEALDNMLSQQGQDRESIKQQVKLQLTIEKLYANEATVSAEEVAQFVEQNKDQLRASDSAGQQQEAFEALKNQKVSQIFSQKFQDLRSKAQIKTF